MELLKGRDKACLATNMKIHILVRIVKPTLFYPDAFLRFSESRMGERVSGGVLGGGRSPGQPPKSKSSGRLEWVGSSVFCDMGNCVRLASWRVGAGNVSFKFCSKHALRAMRDRRLWRG